MSYPLNGLTSHESNSSCRLAIVSFINNIVVSFIRFSGPRYPSNSFCFYFKLIYLLLLLPRKTLPIQGTMNLVWPSFLECHVLYIFQVRVPCFGDMVCLPLTGRLTQFLRQWSIQITLSFSKVSLGSQGGMGAWQGNWL